VRRLNQAAIPCTTIVGVVGDIKLNGLDTASAPVIYTPVYQFPSYGSVVYVRTDDDPGTLGDAVRHEVQAVDPGIPVFGLRTMDEIVAQYLAERRFALDLLGAFGAGALLLAAIGIYGVMAYTFSQRINEIGIRIAMGAQRGDILKMAVVDGAVIVVIGVVSGIAGAALLTRFIQSLLFAVQPTDPITYVAISALLAAVTLLASLVPARKATRVDPLIALRQN
jgi:putative ABC transport system permease protein